MVLVRGNRDLSHAYAVEFFRIFEHMRYRNQIEATAGQGAPSQGTASSSSSSKCGCGQAVAERIVKKPGQNCGRSFLCCANPVSNSCGFFSWSPGTAEPESSEEERPWPQRCFQPELGFDALERRMLGALWSSPSATTTTPTPTTPTTEECCEAAIRKADPAEVDARPPAVEQQQQQRPAKDQFEQTGQHDTGQNNNHDNNSKSGSRNGADEEAYSLQAEAMLEAMGAVEGLADTDQADCCDNNSNADSERDQPLTGATPLSKDEAAAAAASASQLLPVDSLLREAQQVAQLLVQVDSNVRGGTARYRELRDQLLQTVRLLPGSSPERGPALAALEAMDAGFVAKTK
ncbi:unnamed protein product, partial [Polarella glacialis]